MTGVALQGEVVPPPEPPPDELEPPIICAPDELEPAIICAPDELEPASAPDELEPAPEELELDELVTVIVGDPEPPEPEDVEAPEPPPLEPKPVDPPPELEPPMVPFDPDELEPGSEGPGLPWLPVESELPHAATEPASPQRIANVVRRCIVLHAQ